MYILVNSRGQAPTVMSCVNLRSAVYCKHYSQNCHVAQLLPWWHLENAMIPIAHSHSLKLIRRHDKTSTPLGKQHMKNQIVPHHALLPSGTVWSLASLLVAFVATLEDSLLKATMPFPGELQLVGMLHQERFTFDLDSSAMLTMVPIERRLLPNIGQGDSWFTNLFVITQSTNPLVLPLWVG